MTYEITNIYENTKKIRLPDIAWRKIKEAILGKRYSVSIAVIDDKEMRRVGRILRSRKDAAKKFPKSHVLNVLSFPFTKDKGEIVLNAELIRKEAKKLKQPFRKRLLFLYIHGLLHLKEYTHKKKGDALEMEKAEAHWVGKFL